MGIRHYTIFILLTLIHFSFSRSTAQSWLWAKSIGGYDLDAYFPYDLNDYARSVAVDPVSGDVYTLGKYQGTADFDPGDGVFNLTSEGVFDIFLCKLDSLGHFVWAKSMGGYNEDEAMGIAIDPSNGHIYITGGTYGGDFDPGSDTYELPGGFFLSHFDSDGHLIWVFTIGYVGDRGHSIAIDTTGRGGIYITGMFNGTADFDPGDGVYNLTSTGHAVFILKLDQEGSFAWAKVIDGEANNTNMGFSIALDLSSTGFIYVTGFFSDSSVDFDPGPDEYLLNAEIMAVFILKLDIAGDFVWAKVVGESSYSAGLSLAVDTAGNGDVYVTGIFNDTSDFDPGPDTFYLNTTYNRNMFILKLNSDGEFVWAWDPCEDISSVGFGNSVIVDPDGSGDIYFGGLFLGPIDFDPGPEVYFLPADDYDGAFVCKLSSSGNFIWARSAGGQNGYDGAYTIAYDPSGNGYIYVVGYFQSFTIDFGSTTLINLDNIIDYEYSADIFIAKLEANQPVCSNIVTNPDNNGVGSLRNIIDCATSGTTITFDLAPLSEINLLTGEIVINKNIIISGPGMDDLTLSANNTARIFRLLPGVNLGIQDLSLTNSFGAAIYIRGNLTLENVLLEYNYPRSLTLDSPGRLTVEGNVQIKP